MTKNQIEDMKRTEELKVLVWSNVARNSMGKDKINNEITIRSIESNRGRQTKAIRLLGGIVSIGRIERVKGVPIQYYNVHDFNKSLSYAEKPSFDTDIKSLHDDIVSIARDQFEMDTIAYKVHRYMSGKESLYVYWNQDEFDIKGVKEDFVVYPKVLLEQRTKTMLRSIVEQYFHNNYHSMVEKRLSLSKGSLKTEDHTTINVRNFTAHGYLFNEESFTGKNGFMDEYTHFRDYFQALTKNLSHLQKVIEAAGGYAALLKEFRLESINEILSNSPMHIFNKDYDAYNDDVFNSPYLNTFILRNSQHFNYETLYNDDLSILVINEDNSSEYAKKTPFNPDQNEIAMILTSWQ